MLFLKKQKIQVKNKWNPCKTILKAHMFKRKPSGTNKSHCVINFKKYISTC